MTIDWQEHDGLIGVMMDGQLSDPFMYIVAKNPPPWIVEKFDGTTQAFDSLEAAQLAILIGQKGGHDG